MTAETVGGRVAPHTPTGAASPADALDPYRVQSVTLRSTPASRPADSRRRLHNNQLIQVTAGYPVASAARAWYRFARTQMGLNPYRARRYTLGELVFTFGNATPTYRGGS